jgi:hypothetical protein
MEETKFVRSVVELYNELNDDQWFVNSFYFASIVGAMIENKKMKIYEGNFTLVSTLKKKFNEQHWIWEYIDVVPYLVPYTRGAQ